jgi:hypothetical protein
MIDSQPALFREMPEQPPKQSPIERRRKAMEKALEHAGEKFREAFTAFVIRHLTRHGSATAEEIREAYEKTANPRPRSWRATGGIFTRLRHDGRIVEVGKKRSKRYGNDIAVVALAKEEHDVAA